MSARIEIEQDGPRYRWVLMLGDRRLAKAPRWWNSVVEAEEDSAEFLDALREMP